MKDFDKWPNTVVDDVDAQEEKGIDLSRFGLDKSFYLERYLGKYNKEDVEEIIVAISKKCADYFSNDGRVVKTLLEIFNTSVDLELLCKQLADFHYFADTFIEIAKTQFLEDEEDGVKPENGRCVDIKRMKTDIFLIINLAKRSNGQIGPTIVKLTQIKRDTEYKDFISNGDAVGTMWGLSYNGLQFSTQSIDSMYLIFKFSREQGFDLKKIEKTIFGDRMFQNTGKKNADGTTIYEPDEVFKKWVEATKQGLITERLKMFKNAFKYGYDSQKITNFSKSFNEMTLDQQTTFVLLAKKLFDRGVNPCIVIDNMDLFSEECDLTKRGLDMFKEPYQEHPYNRRADWLRYISDQWVSNPNNIPITAYFFNDAMSPKKTSVTKEKGFNIPNIKGLNNNELLTLQDEVDDVFDRSRYNETVESPLDRELQELAIGALKSALDRIYKQTEKIEAIGMIRDHVPASAKLIEEFDREKADQLTEVDLIKFIKFLGSDKEEVMPITLTKSREMILANLKKNINLADYFIENLSKYYQQPWVQKGILEAFEWQSVANKFIIAAETKQENWIDEPWVTDLVTKAKEMLEASGFYDHDEDSYYHNGGNGSEGFSEIDPFENHRWKFTTNQVKMTSLFVQAMGGSTESIEQLEKLGFEMEGNFFEALSGQIEEKYKTDFLKRIENNSKISDEDKDALINPSSVGISSLLDKIKCLIARFYIQSRHSEDGGDNIPITINKDDIDNLLDEGFEKYIKALEIDIPLYDKLYQEFDSLRETGRYPLEVFLGRDGIYAWIGRRAQDIARRRKLGLEGRQRLRNFGEIIEIKPQYTVYPRYFRDNLDYETRREFLEQERISPDTDPLFYDTGYTGTIPEQIMRIMDFESEDIEKRIRLLSAQTARRRVKGISENARTDIVEYIEHNAKLEDTAVGLIKDKETGKIRPIAEPTSPREQFHYMMIKQAIARHYWLQEKLHHEPSGNINLDSEHYTIRIRQEYAKSLPNEFIKDPESYLADHGKLLKGSEGGGEYPDEEILLLKLNDDTEIVAKRIELRKAKEARKEFSILIAAKKAGLPTAEPVGFLSGKTTSNPSYLLMEKIEGYSGRTFEKELKALGRFSDDRIKEIMGVVAAKNAELAENFRKTLHIDKRWRIKDTIINFNPETEEVESVIPIDWERVQPYNPESPKQIDEIK